MEMHIAQGSFYQFFTRYPLLGRGSAGLASTSWSVPAEKSSFRHLSFNSSEEKLSLLSFDKTLPLATLTLTHCFAFQLFLASQMSMLPSDKVRLKYTGQREVKGSMQKQVKLVQVEVCRGEERRGRFWNLAETILHFLVTNQWQGRGSSLAFYVSWFSFPKLPTSASTRS